jgi:hypothetical protein
MKLITFAFVIVIAPFIFVGVIVDKTRVVESSAASPHPTPTCTPDTSKTPPDDNPFQEPTADELLDGPLGSSDVDCDGVRNSRDNCLLTYNPTQVDKDNDRIGDACEPDPHVRSVRFLKCDNDGDGLIDEADNCPLVCNPDQTDINRNRIGDACDPAFPKAVLAFQACPNRINVKLPFWLSRRLTKP